MAFERQNLSYVYNFSSKIIRNLRAKLGWHVRFIHSLFSPNLLFRIQISKKRQMIFKELFTTVRFSSLQAHQGREAMV